VTSNNCDGNIVPASGSSLHSGTSREKGRVLSLEEAKECYRRIVREPLNQAAGIGEADIVVGIPFYNEADTIPAVLKTVSQGLKEFYPDQECVIVLAGAPAGGEALRVINTLPQVPGVGRIAFLLSDEGVSGKGWSNASHFRDKPEPGRRPGHRGS